MKASIVAILFACLLSLCVSTPKDAENTPWDGMNCEELKAMKSSDDLSQEKISDMVAACEENKKFVDNLRKQGDLSVVYSTYMRETRESFKDLFTMHELKFGGVTPDLAGIPETTDGEIVNVWDKVSEDKQKKMIAVLDTILENHYRIYAKKSDYVVYAAIDLMNLVYTREFDNNGLNSEEVTWKFSTEQVRQELAPGEEYNNAKLVFEYLSEEGVCLEDDYYIQGDACRRYFIGNYYRLLDMTNQGLVDKLESGHPVYAQVALQPEIFQFHSPTAEHPIGKGYFQPTYAGVVTGFNFTNKGKNYWNMYIRRHELHPELDHGFIQTDYENYNHVRIAAKFEDKDGNLLNPFAGITSMSYTIDVDEEDRDRGLTVNKLLKVNLGDGDTGSIKNKDELQKAVTASIKAMYGLGEDSDKEVEKHIEEIETLYVHPKFFNTTELISTNSSLNIKEVLPNLHTVSIDLGEGGNWNEDYPYVIQDFYDYDLTFVDETHMNRRRLKDEPNEKYGTKDPRHKDYKYDGREYDYTKHYFTGLGDDHKKNHIKVTGKLKNLIFGRYTMPFMSLIVMHSPYLEYIYAKDYSFKYGWYIRIEGCESLKQISFGLHTFSGWEGSGLPIEIKMDLIDLPKLDTFVFDYDAAFNIRHVNCTEVGKPGYDFTLVEDRAFPNLISYTNGGGNHEDVNTYFRRIFPETPSTSAPGPTAEPEPDE